MSDPGSVQDAEVFSLRIAVSAATGRQERLQVAVNVICPNPKWIPTNPIVYFGYPGGGYNRHYFDLSLSHLDDRAPYSQARFHAARGEIFVACDHIGVGGSDIPTAPLDYHDVALMNVFASREVISRLRAGSLIPGLGPLIPRATVGIGQAFGGFLLTLAQAEDPVFDGVAFLGWSALRTDPGWPAGVDVASILRNGTRGDDPHNPRRRTYHWTDVPAEIVIADLTRVPGSAGANERWGARYHPGGPLLVADRNPVAPGVVAREAAAISAPVLVVAGETDVMDDPWAEPSAYRSSGDVTLCVFPSMAHMHNFSSNRLRLWRRLSEWAGTVADTRQ